MFIFDLVSGCSAIFWDCLYLVTPCAWKLMRELALEWNIYMLYWRHAEQNVVLCGLQHPEQVVIELFWWVHHLRIALFQDLLC